MTDFSYQLYSSRNFDLGDTLKMLGRLGYKQAEGFGGLFADDAAVSKLKAGLDANGLTMPTIHIGYADVRDTPDRVLKICKTLGVKAVFVPHLMPADRPSDAAGWKAFGAALSKAGQPLRDAGMDFGWHNHDFEFKALPDGSLPQDHIFAGNDLSVELDVAWVVRGGKDPIAWIQANADRIIAAHVKDIAPAGQNADEDGWADVGHGVVPWASIMAALRKTPCRYFVMEHDNPKDHERFATRSIAAAKTL